MTFDHKYLMTTNMNMDAFGSIELTERNKYTIMILTFGKTGLANRIDQDQTATARAV